MTIISFMLFSSCEDKVYEKYTANVPVYLKHKDLHKSIEVKNDNQELSKPGRIYFKDNYIYINEYYEGIHVIDNSDPSNPVKVKFIKIPGNVDLAIKGDILYGNNAVDLVALNISDLENIYEVGRVDSIFPYGLPEWNPDYRVSQIDVSEGYVIGWEIKEVKEEILATPGYFVYDDINYMTEDMAFSDFSSKQTTRSYSSGSATSGIAGSMASFMLYDNYLYAIENSHIKIIDISNLETPVLHNSFSVEWGIETLFVYENHLFIGSQTGMHVYGLDYPENPVFISTFEHIRSCDPVVVEGNYAYVTLRSGSSCGGFTNQLDIVDISNLNSPKLVKTYQLQNPYGLGIDSTTLFICDGDAGLKVYDVETPTSLRLIQKFTDINTFDVIPIHGVLVMIGNDGLYQYDYNDLSNITLLSSIAIIRE